MYRSLYDFLETIKITKEQQNFIKKTFNIRENDIFNLLINKFYNK
jgi:hypothetical protein